MLFLSGLVLELNYPIVANYKGFILKRLKRIYPVYIVCFFFSLTYFLISTSFNCKICNLKNFILGISGFQAFFGEWGGPILRTGWFIGLIICLYLFFPLISNLIKKKPYLILLLTFIISFFSRLLLGKYDLLPNRALDWFPLSRLFEFSLGIYAANIIPKTFWQIADKLQMLSGSIFFLSEISFPLFLIHYPLLNLINKFINMGLSPALSVIFYLSISFVSSWTINFLTDKFYYRKLAFNTKEK